MRTAKIGHDLRLEASLKWKVTNGGSLSENGNLPMVENSLNWKVPYGNRMKEINCATTSTIVLLLANMCR